MQRALFDSGEGAQKIEVLDPQPTGGRVWRLQRGLACSFSPRRPRPTSTETSRYNDRRMIIGLSLPANYTTVFGAKTWWQIRYTVGASATDRTTWSGNILGDPVQLVGS